MTRPVLHELIRSLRFTNSSTFQRPLYATMFRVAFYGLFRIGKLATKNMGIVSLVVQFHSLTFLSTHEAKISISNYKHKSSNRPFNIILAREDSQPFCPVTALLQYCSTRGDPPGPLFCHADYSPISVHQFNCELHRCLAFCGLDMSRYKSHSFRIGGACHPVDKGYPDAQIRALGSWKSEPFKVYLRSTVCHAN